MITFRTLLLCGLLPLSSGFAAEGEAIVKYPSPKGDLVLLVERRPQAADTVRLEGVSGKLFLTLAVEDEVKDGQVKEGSLLWNAAGDGVAFSVGNSRLLDAFAFIRTKEGWKHLKLPGPGDGGKIIWDNYHALPSKWEGKHLTLTVSGPHAGKADAPTYAGAMTVEIDPEGGSAKKIDETIVVEPAKSR